MNKRRLTHDATMRLVTDVLANLIEIEPSVKAGPSPAVMQVD